jgi:hypothetical protein
MRLGAALLATHTQSIPTGRFIGQHGAIRRPEAIGAAGRHEESEAQEDDLYNMTHWPIKQTS